MPASESELRQPSADVAHTDAHRRWILAFVRMWAIAHLAHLAIANRQALDTPPSLIAFAAAFVLLVRPARGRWLLTLLVAQLADMVWEMPLSPDHWMLVGFVNLAILLSMARRRSTGIEALEAALPAARWLVLIAYSAAAISKYNTTFLDAAQSCATAMASASTFGLSEKLDGPQWFLMTVAVETAIPLLLVIPRTRRHGVRIGLLFHLMLTISPAVAVEDFSSTLYALFFLFLTDDDAGRLLDRLRDVGDRSSIARDARRFPWVFAGAGFAVLGLLGHVSGQVSVGFVIVVSAVYLVAVTGAGVATWREPGGSRRIGTPGLLLAPVLVALLVWAAGPYAGFRTTGAFTMFSSIRTEGEVGNHLFLPTYRLVDWQSDLVVIRESNDPAMASGEDGRLGIPLLGLRRMAMADPGLVVTGDLHGRQVTFGPGEGQVELAPLSWWEEKFLLFRPVPVDGTPYCTVS